MKSNGEYHYNNSFSRGEEAIEIEPEVQKLVLDTIQEIHSRNPLDSLQEIMVDYQRFYDLETRKEARKYIRKDLKYLEEQERGYIIIKKGNKITGKCKIA